MEESTKKRILLTVVLGIMILCTVTVFDRHISEKTLTRMIENHPNIEFYLDGSLVEYDNIDLKFYNFICNEETGKVYLTKK